MKLFLFDPMYSKDDQPSVAQRGPLRVFLDKFSVEGSMAIVFGRAIVTIEAWMPIFADGFNDSKESWFMDPSVFMVQRGTRSLYSQPKNLAFAYRKCSYVYPQT